MSRVAHMPVVTRMTLTPDVRKRIENAIARMMDFLDQCDAPDADMEPSLGAPEQRVSETVFIDGRWSTRQTDQADWAAGCNDDREGALADTADDREGGDVLDDGEETLGWCENIGQGRLGPNMADGDSTAPERHGEGFVRCGRDDFEDSETLIHPFAAAVTGSLSTTGDAYV